MGFAGASGGTAQYSYSVTTGSLPAGLTLIASGAQAGVLAGSPSSVGAYSFTITATDDIGYTGSRNYILAIDRATQTVSFGAAPTVAVNSTGTVTATTTATPSANYPIAFSTTSTACAVTSAGVVTGINGGTNNCLITATQAGDANYNAATTTQTLSIGKKTTTVALMATPNPALVDTPVTIAATVAGDPPTGTMVFCDGATSIDASCTGGTLLCTAVLIPGTVNSTANCVHAFAGQGTHNLSAFYAGDSNFVAAATAPAQVIALEIRPVPAPAVPVPALSAWLLGLLGGLLALAGIANARKRT